MSVPRIVDFESSERLTGKVENVMRSMSWVLTHSLVGILPKKASGYRKLQVTKKAVYSSYNGLLMQLQNIGFRISGMCRKQTFSS